ncbi:MAG: hypothetical protein Q9171_002494 [Xanthocarpia ochracea]
MSYRAFSLALLAVSPVLAADATNSLSVTATPSIPPSVTRVPDVNSILATASTVTDIGNPGRITSYPPCAQICNNETIAVDFVSGDLSDVRVLCGPDFRSLTAGCQAATCHPEEQTRTNILTQQFCGYLYNANATYSSEVLVAVASATVIAKAATEGKDPFDVADFPECAQSCIIANNYQGCGRIIPLCVCQGIEFNAGAGPCQIANCGPVDLAATLYLAEVLCEPVGGILTNPINYTSAVNNGTISNGTNTTVGSPSPSPFTGDGTPVTGRSGIIGLLVTGFAVVIGLLML